MPGYGAITPHDDPPATPEAFICLRGPCRHYWQIQSPMDAGNPDDTWAYLGIEKPRQISRSCLTHPGVETELTDDVVLECNRWDPLTDLELRQRDERRALYQLRARAAPRPAPLGAMTAPADTNLPTPEEDPCP